MNSSALGPVSFNHTVMAEAIEPGSDRAIAFARRMGVERRVDIRWHHNFVCQVNAIIELNFLISRYN